MNSMYFVCPKFRAILWNSSISQLPISYIMTKSDQIGRGFELAQIIHDISIKGHLPAISWRTCPWIWSSVEVIGILWLCNAILLLAAESLEIAPRPNGGLIVIGNLQKLGIGFQHSSGIAAISCSESIRPAAGDSPWKWAKLNYLIHRHMNTLV